MKLLSRTIREHVDSINFNDVLSKMKVDNPHFVIDEEMVNFIKEKEEQEK